MPHNPALHGSRTNSLCSMARATTRRSTTRVACRPRTGGGMSALSSACGLAKLMALARVPATQKQPRPAASELRRSTSRREVR